MQPFFTPRASKTRRRLVQAAAIFSMPLGHLLAAPAKSSGSLTDFVTLSKLITGHNIDPGTAGTVFKVLSASPTFAQDLRGLLGVARSSHAATPEAFSQALQTPALQQSMRRILFAWYAGAADDSPDAKTFLLSEALMYKTTADAMTTPSVCRGATGSWAIPAPDVTAVPAF